MSADRNERIIALLRAGRKAAAIAAELGLSRNIVIGVCWRAGLSRRRIRSSPRKRSGQESSRLGGTVPTGRAPDDLAAVAWPGAHECRWPLWHDHERPTHRYCGGKVEREGASYCKRHADRAYARGAKRTAAERSIDYLAGRAAGGPQKVLAAEAAE